MKKIKNGDTVISKTDFSDLRELYGKYGFQYPNKGDELTVRDIEPHPADKNHSMLYFDGYKNGISLENLRTGVNFVKKTDFSNDCLICEKVLNPTTTEEQMEAGIFGVHLQCRENMTDEDIDVFIKEYESEHGIK